MRIVPLLTSDHNDTKRNDNIKILKTKHFFFYFEIFYHYNKGLIKFRYEQNRN